MKSTTPYWRGLGRPAISNTSRFRRFSPPRSFWIAVRVGLMPAPSAFDNCANMREFWFPAKFLANLAASGHQDRGIAFTARPDFRLDLFPGDLTGRINYFLNGKPLAIAQVVVSTTTVECTQRQNVRLRKVHDVNVVADAGPIPRRIVSSKNQ